MRVRFEGVRFWGFETVVVGRGNALGWGNFGGVMGWEYFNSVAGEEGRPWEWAEGLRECVKGAE